MNIFKRFQICCFSQLNSLSEARLFSGSPRGFWKTTDVMHFISRDTLLLPPSRVSVFQRFTSFFCLVLTLVITSVNADPVASLRLN